MSDGCLTVHALRSRWKPKKLQLSKDHPTTIRLHRAFSWLAQCEEQANSQNPDFHLISLWIAFNGLYGRWDTQKHEPLADGQCWRAFVDQVLAIDGQAHLAQFIVSRRDLIMSILDDEYLSGYFWAEPSDLRASKSKKPRFDARTWYVESKWGLILDRTIERIYLLRCQLIHGAATHGSRLNRTSVDRCVLALRRLLNAVLLAVIDDETSSDWGTMCYPPLNPERSHPA